jgi:hypothetical protein
MNCYITITDTTTDEMSGFAENSGDDGSFDNSGSTIENSGDDGLIDNSGSTMEEEFPGMFATIVFERETTTPNPMIDHPNEITTG